MAKSSMITNDRLHSEGNVILVPMDKGDDYIGRSGDKTWYLIRLNLAKIKTYTGTYITTLQW